MQLDTVIKTPHIHSTTNKKNTFARPYKVKIEVLITAQWHTHTDARPRGSERVSPHTHSLYTRRLCWVTITETRIKLLTKPDETISFMKRFIHLLLIRLPKTPAAHPKLDTLVINCGKRKKGRKKANDFWKGRGNAVCLPLVSGRGSLSGIQTAAITSQSAIDEQAHPNSFPCALQMLLDTKDATQRSTWRGTESA